MKVKSTFDKLIDNINSIAAMENLLIIFSLSVST